MNKKLYIIMVIIGITLILFAIMPIVFIIENNAIGTILTNDMFNNILISLGCGVITSTLVSFYIERSNRFIVEEHGVKMKRNILNDLIETVKNYSDEDFDFIKIENMIKSDFLKEIIHLCESYIPMGMQFYSDVELKTLKELYHSSISLYNILQEENILELYKKYKDIFSEAVNYKFEYGPYSEEEKIKRICKVLRLSVNEKELCNIGESIYLYHLQNNAYNKFLDIFSV